MKERRLEIFIESCKRDEAERQPCSPSFVYVFDGLRCVKFQEVHTLEDRGERWQKPTFINAV